MGESQVGWREGGESKECREREEREREREREGGREGEGERQRERETVYRVRGEIERGESDVITFV